MNAPNNTQDAMAAFSPAHGSGVRSKFKTIVADPPWPIGDFPAWYDEEKRSEREKEIGHNPTPYKTMTLDDIKALPVGGLADGQAHLYLWTTDSFMVDALDVARSWGFEKAATLVWCKNPMGRGLGGTYVNNVEFCIFATRNHGQPETVKLTNYLADAAERKGISRREVDAHMGTSDMGGWWLSRLPHRCACPTNEQWPKLKALLGVNGEADEMVERINGGKGEKLAEGYSPTRWWNWPRGKHSAKPEAFQDVVESVSPGPYLELFARRQRLGWATWGNEALNHVELVLPNS